MLQKLKNLFYKPPLKKKPPSEILFNAWQNLSKAHELLQISIFGASGVAGGDMSEQDKIYFHAADFNLERLTNELRIKYENRRNEESGRSYIKR
jgi:hypothetical protein